MQVDVGVIEGEHPLITSIWICIKGHLPEVYVLEVAGKTIIDLIVNY